MMLRLPDLKSGARHVCMFGVYAYKGQLIPTAFRIKWKFIVIFRALSNLLIYFLSCSSIPLQRHFH